MKSDSEDAGLPIKKIKLETSEVIASRLKHISKKVVQDTNATMALSEFEGRIDTSHVKVSSGGPGESLKVSVLCLLCKKDLALSSTPTSTEIGNFKRHFLRVHIEPESKEGSESAGKLKMKKKSVGLLTNYFKSTKTSDGQPEAEAESASSLNLEESTNDESASK